MLEPTQHKNSSEGGTLRKCVGICDWLTLLPPALTHLLSITVVDGRLARQKAQLSAKRSRKMRLFRLFRFGNVPTSAPKTMIYNCKRVCERGLHPGLRRWAIRLIMAN